MSTIKLPDEPTEAFPYRIETQAGTGAMGIVYRAVDLDLERPVAIKILKAEDKSGPSDEQRKRFLQEARAAAALSHPGVTTVYRIGWIEGAPYIAMEWLEGRTLDRVLEEDGPLPTDRAAGVLLELLGVLEAAHGSNVVHRDIKPSNLILLEGGRLKVTDFGIALLQGRELVKTMDGSVMATPRYASPEQLQGMRVDRRSDLFSAAVVFYQILTRALPWEGRNLPELVTAIFSNPPIPTRDRNPQLPAELDTWFLRALAKDREKRFQTATEMAHELQEALGPAPATDERLESSRTTKIMAPPRSIFVAQNARTPWEAVVELIRSWTPRDLGSMPCQDFLSKLLDVPLHADPFAGAAFLGDRCLLVEGGVVLAIVDVESGLCDPDAELPDRGEVRLFAAPQGFRPGFITLLASGLQKAPILHDGLDTEAVDLPAFTGKLLEKGFEGCLRIEDGNKFMQVLLLEGTAELALLSPGWPDDLQKIGWQGWLGKIAATAAFSERLIRPPALWFRRGFQGLEFSVRAELPARSAKDRTSETLSLSSVLRTDDFSETHLLSAQNEGPSRIGQVEAASAPMARFLDWMLRELPRELVERKKSKAWKYLADWLLMVERARLYADVERPGQAVSDYFDLVTEDKGGKILHLGHRLGYVDAEKFQCFVDRAISAKEARVKRGDVGGVFLVSPSFSEVVLDHYRALLNKGMGNRLLGLDKSLGYEGFVRMSARRGFHLLLVEEKDGGFKPHFLA